MAEADPPRKGQNKSPSDRWHVNEEELQRLADLPVGPVDPAERERQLDREQDQIEGQLSREWYEQRSQERIAKYGAALFTQLCEALSHAAGRQVSASEAAQAISLLERAIGPDLDLSSPESMRRLVILLRKA